MATWPLLEPSMSAPYSSWSCCQLQVTTEISNEKLDKTMNFKWLMMVVACLWKTSFGLNLNSCSVLKLLWCKSVFSMGGNFWEFWRRGCNIWDGKNRRLYNFRVFARPAQSNTCLWLRTMRTNWTKRKIWRNALTIQWQSNSRIYLTFIWDINE